MLNRVSSVPDRPLLPDEIILCLHTAEHKWEYKITPNQYTPPNTDIDEQTEIEDHHLWEYIIGSQPRWFLLQVDVPVDIDPTDIVQIVCEWITTIYNSFTPDIIRSDDVYIDEAIVNDTRRIRIKFRIQLSSIEDEHEWINQLLTTLTACEDLPEYDPADYDWFKYLRLDINMQRARYIMWPLQTVGLDIPTQLHWIPVNYTVRIDDQFSYLTGIYNVRPSANTEESIEEQLTTLRLGPDSGGS